MMILVVDGQGGGLGRLLVRELKGAFPQAEIAAVGTNSTAANAMMKAGADFAATGENAVVVNCRHADIIVGAVGIVIADSMWGEITPRMAQAVGQSDARRVLIPINLCSNLVVGVSDKTEKHSRSFSLSCCASVWTRFAWSAAALGGLSGVS